jgi:O-antigen biosynthesis protein
MTSQIVALQIADQAETDPRNIWARLFQALDLARAGQTRQARIAFDAIKYAPALRKDGLGDDIQHLYARQLDLLCQQTNPDDNADFPKFNSPADFLGSTDPRVLLPLRTLDISKTHPAPYPVGLALPRHQGAGNATQFLYQAAATFSAHTGRRYGAGQGLNRTILIIHSPDTAAAATALIGDLNAQDFAGHIRLAVFWPQEPTGGGAGTGAETARVQIDRYTMPLLSPQGTAQLGRLTTTEASVDLVIFVSGAVRLDNSAVARADHLGRISDRLVQPLIPALGSDNKAMSPTTLFSIGAAQKTISARYPFRDVAGLNFALSTALLHRTGLPDGRFQTLYQAGRELAFRCFNTGAWFEPLQVTAVAEVGRKEGTSAPELADKALFIGLCPNHWDRKKDGTYAHPKISIYIPAYNAQNYIRDAIDSVLNQDLTDLEVCIADDGSRDGTLALLEQTYGAEPRVRVVSNPNGGIGYASNQAIEMARGLYIGQLDSDDRLKPGAVRQLVDYLDAHPDIVCCYSACERVDAGGTYLQDEYNWPIWSHEKMMITSIAHHFRMFRKQAWERTSHFRQDIANAVDYDMFLKLAETGGFHHLDKKLYQRRWHGDNTSHVNEGTQTGNTYHVQREALARQGLAPFWDVYVPDPKLPRKVTYRRKPGKRMVLFWSDYSRSNPYQKLLYGKASRDVEFCAGPIEAATVILDQTVAQKGDPGQISFHLHWLNFLLRDVTTQLKAERYVADYLAKLEAFKAKGGHLVWTIHNTLSHDSPFAALEQQMSQRIVELADVLHVHSAASVPEISAAFVLDPAKIAISRHGHYGGVYPNYVSRAVARGNLGIDPDEDVILFSGQVRPYKGVETLIAAFSTLLADRPKARLLIAGEMKADILGALLTPLSPVERARIQIVARFIEDTELQLFFAAADVAVYPYHNILTSGSLLLALSFGTPAIIPEVGMTREVLGNTDAGVLYGGPDGTTLGAALARVMAQKDAGKLAVMQTAARAAALAQDWPDLQTTLFTDQTR